MNPTVGPLTEPLRIANCSGFYGDRLSAAVEMVNGGPIDVLTGDWLAELTMLILAKTQAKGGPGYARTFVTQMEQVMATCLQKGIKVVSNAGGLDPHACASAVEAVAAKLGLSPKVAVVSGDNLLTSMDSLRADGHVFANLDTGEAFGDRQAVSANAYLGGWGIADALRNGADIVVTGRVTDAALVVGPAAWKFGWTRTDWDQLAGAVVAGHVIECGCQATGGNYSFFTEIPGLERPGFPIAEMYADGSSVITKHPGTGGAVTVGTVTAQLLYEIDGAEYLNPDVVSHFDSIQLEQLATDKVRIHSVRGSAAPETLKVAINIDGGFRNRFTFCLTGLDIEAKAALVERTLWAQIPGGKESIQQVRTDLVRTDREDPETNEQGIALLRITVKDPDERKVGRAFANAAIEMALASYPGMFGSGAPTGAEPFGVYWPSLIPPNEVPHLLTMDSVTRPVEIPESDGRLGFVFQVSNSAPQIQNQTETGETVRVPLGRIVGARSGDKGGNANIGLWTKTVEQYEWLVSYLTLEKVKLLLPETANLDMRITYLPNLCALNIVVVGLLDEGVAASTRFDGQAKGLGEWLRARLVDIPAHL
jgi:Acyclic terpene utilisation family protein AtuA